MKNLSDIFDETLSDVERARKRLGKGRSKQVTRLDDVDYLKSVSYAWFNSYRKVVLPDVSESSLKKVDDAYRQVLNSTAKNAARATYVTALKRAKSALTALRADVLTVTARKESATLLTPPDFSSIVADEQMRLILVERWMECQKCLGAGAYLAATVMMGGLLEALFMARANQLSDKKPLFSAKSTPMDSKTKKPLQLPEWTLRPYIDVAHEIGWITRSGKDVAAILRDYRNYVHPEKQRSHGVTLNGHDAKMFWDVTRNLALQLLGMA